ncbi:TBC1 domain family member 2A-like isoform X1 [Scleropages formosus]|uniref:TBC1 domain family member 2A-like isoform X1 n=1 Tax=Scleropages formosus TaxID=113540 RepID=UPI0010FAB11B|nr:TBC1 domain family member 2A-like isoform X1 [Scleropages formosus]XP_029114980.1 TBC1 domain family member 2A-like isoform X1 [Scleropages formosus]
MESHSPRMAEPGACPLQPDPHVLHESVAPVENPGEAGANGLGPSDWVRRGEEPHRAKLCGYLGKLGGPLKSWKCRWFVYEEKQCQLFYYRTAQDVNPLGRIELASATFGFSLQAEEAVFHIQTPERVFVLKAVSRDAMMYWLQQLQLKRWQHRDPAEEPVQACGLTGLGGEHVSSHGHDVFLPIVKTPPGLVGEEAANLPAPKSQSTLSNVSFKHPLTEIQNSVHNLCRHRSQDLSRSVFCSEQSTALSSSGSPVLMSEDAVAPTAPATTPGPLADPGRESPWEEPSLTVQRSGSPVPMTAEVQQVSLDKELSLLQQKVLSPAEEAKAEKQCLPAAEEWDKSPGDQSDSSMQELQEQLVLRDARIVQLEEHVQLMMEKNQAKQEVILRLSEQVAECLADPGRKLTSTMGARTFRQLQEEVEQLKDDIEAYKIQNKFLNSEIYQLTKLWRNSSEQEKSLMKKCALLEAKCCQMEGRYLGVLKQLQENGSLGVQQKDLVNRLIQDELQEDMVDTIKLHPNSEYDEYGFKLIQDYDVEDMKLLAKIHALEIRSHNLLEQEAGDKQRLSRWAQYVGKRPLGELVPSPELKALLRGGVPRQYRASMWRCVVRARTQSLRERHPERYRELCGKGQASQHPAARQILLDLHRTLTSNQHFSSPSSPTLEQLHRILLAFSWQNPSIGYCQGLNRLAAIALLVLQNEEDAFWCLVAIVETIMPKDYYSKSLTASQADQRVLKELVAEKLPRLAVHFEEYGVDVSLITFNWFLVVFVEDLASKILLCVWDAFLYEGTKVLFRYALALFKYKEEDILKIHDKVEIYQYLRFFTRTISDCRKLTNIAFVHMNPFPMKLLRNRRAYHLERLEAELHELERIQEEFASESAESKDKDLSASLSDEEEDL